MRCAILLFLLVSVGFGATVTGNFFNTKFHLWPIRVVEINYPAGKIQPKHVLEKALHQARNPIDDIIRDVLEIVRQLMLNGTENIPPLDPFFIEYLLVNFTSADAE